MRDSIYAAAEAGWGKAEAPRGKALKGKAAAAARAAAAGAAAPIFPPELNEEWSQLLWRFDLFLSPIMRIIKRMLTSAAEPSEDGAERERSASNAQDKPSAPGNEAQKHKVRASGALLV